MFDPIYTVSLERMDTTDTLRYKVSVSEKDNEGSFDKFAFETEDYEKAYDVAKSYHDFLSEEFPKQLTASYVEMPSYRSAQGAHYSISGFLPEQPIDLGKEFYQPMAYEFREVSSRVAKPDYNTVFRTIVAKNKLNLYQERSLLEHLKDRSIVELE